MVENLKEIKRFGIKETKQVTIPIAVERKEKRKEERQEREKGTDRKEKHFWLRNLDVLSSNYKLD